MKIYFVRIIMLIVFIVLIIHCSHTLQAQGLTINSPVNISATYTNIDTATFGPSIFDFGEIVGGVVASEEIEGCSPFVNSPAVMGNIALINRGSCQFQQKAGNAQASGAIAAIICLVDDSEPFTMGGINDTLVIPTIMITKSLCDKIRMELPGVNVSIISQLTDCTDPCATNYNPNATEDDGSCTLPSPDDGCALTIDSLDLTTCTILNMPIDIDDGCPLTTDSFDAANCTVVNTPPDVDDGCPNTDDSFDINTCQILNVSNCPEGTTLDNSCVCVGDTPFCQPDSTFINSEFFFNPPPDSIGESCSLNQGILNEPYEQTFTVAVPNSLPTFLGGNPVIADIISITVDSIVGLPNGVSYSCVPLDCIFISNSAGCISLIGTPSQAGTYSPIIYATLLVNLGFDVSFPIEIPNQESSFLPFPPLGEREYIIIVYPDNSTPQNCLVTGGGVAGCTSPDACNFDATAIIDDGTCILPGNACNDGNPLTDNDTVQADCSCQGEIIDSDVVPTVGEWGLIILALLLLNLGVLYIRQTEIRIEI